MKKVVWNKKTLKEVRSFPEEIRKDLGYLVYRLQTDDLLIMPLSRSMPSLGIGCHELRLKDKTGIYRVFYFLKIKDEILIFHAFQKKTEKTLQREIETGRKNLKELLDEKK